MEEPLNVTQEPRYTPPPLSEPPAAPEKKSNTLMIVLIVALVVVCCCCATAAIIALGYWVSTQPDLLGEISLLPARLQALV